MNIKDLEYLVALAEHKHFKNAAIACNVSQPTLSGQIKKLEDALGIALLERTSRRVFFTESGLLLVEQAQKILDEIKKFKEMARNQTREMEGPLHIGIIPTLGPYIIPYIIPYVKQEYPNLDLFIYELQTSQIVEKLNIGKLDCAIVAQTYETKDFIERPLFKETMLLAVNSSSDIAKKNSIKSKDLKKLELLLLEKGHCLRDDILAYCAGDMKENKYVKASSIEMIKNIISANIGIALLPELSILGSSLNNEKISYIKVTDPEPTRDLIMIYRPGSPLKRRYEKLAEISKNIINNLINK